MKYYSNAHLQTKHCYASLKFTLTILISFIVAHITSIFESFIVIFQSPYYLLIFFLSFTYWITDIVADKVHSTAQRISKKYDTLSALSNIKHLIKFTSHITAHTIYNIIVITLILFFIIIYTP